MSRFARACVEYRKVGGGGWGLLRANYTLYPEKVSALAGREYIYTYNFIISMLRRRGSVERESQVAMFRGGGRKVRGAKCEEADCILYSVCELIHGLYIKYTAVLYLYCRIPSPKKSFRKKKIIYET